MSVLPSDLTTVPVRWSPFFRVTWSANEVEANPKNAVKASISSFPSTAEPPKLQSCQTSMWEPGGYCELIRNTGEEADSTAVWTTRRRSRLALGFGVLALVGRSLCGRLVFHAVFQSANPLTQTFAQLRQLPGTEHQQRNKEDDQQVHRLK